MISINFNGRSKTYPFLRAMSIEEVKQTVLPILVGVYDVRATALEMQSGRSAVVIDRNLQVKTENGIESAGIVAERLLEAAGLNTGVTIGALR